MLADLLYAIRQFARAPAFAVAAVLTLALGTGANSAVVGLINSFMRPLPVPDADRIVVLAAETPGDETGFQYRFSYPALQDIREQADGFSDIFGFDTWLGGLSAGDTTTQFIYHVVTGRFFPALGIVPHAGTFFQAPHGEQSGTELVLVLGHSYWQKRFGGDLGVIGSIVRIDGQAARVIGIAPPTFKGLYHGTEMDGYVPLGAMRGRGRPASELFTDRSTRLLTLVGRLRPEATLATVASRLDAVAERIGQAHPATDGHIRIHVLPEPLARPLPLRFLSRTLPLIKSLLFVLSSLVLGIACMNVTNLLFVRATVRQREMAVRAALGSGRARLVRLLLAESLILAAAGSAAGLVLGKWAIELLVSSIHLGISLTITFDTGVNWATFSYTMGVAVATGVAMGVLPAVRASRTSVTDLLHDGARGGSSGAGRQRLRRVLVVAQMAGSLLLLIVAGLFVRSLERARWMDVGFDREHVLIAQLDPAQIGYDMPRTRVFYDDLMRRLEAMPGVEAATMAFTMPLGFIFGGYAIRAEGEIARADESPPAIGFNSVSPTYFDMLKMPIVQGRGFTDQDTFTSTRVAIVNETLAKRLWPAEDAIGRRFVVPGIDEKLWQVVGIAVNSKYIAVFEDPLPYFYLPLTQNPMFMRTVAVRSRVPPELLSGAMAHEIEALDRRLPSADVRTLRSSIEGGLGFLLFKTGAMQAAALGLLGLLLAVVGLYGIVSYSATQRTREIGIRLALGAEPSHVRALVLRQGVTLVAGGILAGLVATGLVTRAMTKLLFAVSSTDPLTFALVTLLLAATALVACYLPARRAMRVDPVEALRHE